MAHLFILEMNPHTYSRLLYNLYSNIFPIPTVLNQAVGPANETIELNSGNGNTGQSLLWASPEQTDFSVRMRTINDLVSEYFPEGRIDVAKIDIEGSEHSIFAGNDWDALKRCRYIIMEIHEVPESDRTDIVSVLKDAQFDLLMTADPENPGVFCFANRTEP